jgi:hypothetical protein
MRRTIGAIGLGVGLGLGLGLFLSGADDSRANQTVKPESQPAIHVTTRLVPVAVTVAGKDGLPVTDLEAKDFAVWDEDAPVR